MRKMADVGRKVPNGRPGNPDPDRID